MKKAPFKNINIRVVTLSDRASEGVYPDKSGPLITEILENYFSGTYWNYELFYDLIPDDAEKLKEILAKSIATKEDVIITTGGTGVGPRDFTPEVLL